MDNYIYENSLMHYGTPRHSGRYPWGSGDNPYQHEQYGFLAKYRELKDRGLSEKEMSKEMGMSIADMRRNYSAALSYEKAAMKARAIKLREEKGYSYRHIGEMMGLPDTTIGNWCKEKDQKQEKIADTVADILMKNVDEKGYIDVGSGTELEMTDLLRASGKDIGVSADRMRTAVKIAQNKGYVLQEIHVEQVTNPGKYTNMLILGPEGTTKKDIWEHVDDIHSVSEHLNPVTMKVSDLKRPESLDSSRVYIRYAEDGGKDRDGTIELRRGVDDLSMGSSSYGQVRVLVDGTHYMKGMAFYSDDIPKGYDVVYNTNKKKGTDPGDVFKKIKDNPDNPFGATIKANGQILYPDPNGKYTNEFGEKCSLGVVNKIKEEGDWDHYKKSLASQMLSKQSDQLIKRQLDLSYADKEAEFDSIMAVDNKEVRNKLLQEFADNCDAAAVHLDAAALPRQTTKVLLPVTSLKDNEIYAPTYKDGETVCLIRYPHGGTFEIPELVVNNKNKDAQKIVGNKAVDAVGINANVASRLSGADFDGDTALVIPSNGPNSKVRIISQKDTPLKQLEGFDPNVYEKYDGMKVLTKQRTQTEMGVISNLITDMTLQGASDDELARAVKHSMVIIDANKHELNYKLSEEQNGIKALHKKYQGKVQGGAATLLSRAGSKKAIDDIKRSYTPDPETGEWDYIPTGKTKTDILKKTVKEKDPITGEVKEKKYYIRKDGGLDAEYVKGTEYLTKETPRKTRKYSQMLLAKDARELISDSQTTQEQAYADYANKLKALANKSRKTYFNDRTTEKVNKQAQEDYAYEVASLKSKLNNALKNKPKERKAQLIASERVNRLKTKDMSNDDIKKLKDQSMTLARQQAGANKKDVQVQITEKEWEAIQNNAISGTTLRSILNNTDTDALRKMATPKDYATTVTDAKANKMKRMAMSGYTLQEISEATGFSPSTIAKYIKE